MLFSIRTFFLIILAFWLYGNADQVIINKTLPYILLSGIQFSEVQVVNVDSNFVVLRLNKNERLLNSHNFHSINVNYDLDDFGRQLSTGESLLFIDDSLQDISLSDSGLGISSLLIMNKSDQKNIRHHSKAKLSRWYVSYTKFAKLIYLVKRYYRSGIEGFEKNEHLFYDLANENLDTIDKSFMEQCALVAELAKQKQ